MKRLFLFLFAISIFHLNFLGFYYLGIYGLTDPFVILTLIYGFVLIKNKSIKLWNNQHLNFLVIFLISISFFGIGIIAFKNNFSSINTNYQNDLSPNSLERLKAISFLLFTYATFNNLKNSIEWLLFLKKITWILFLGSSTILIFYIFKINLFDRFYNEFGEHAERAAGIYGNPNFAGYIGNLTLASLCYLRLKGVERNNYLYYTKILVLIASIILTFSNTSIFILVLFYFSYSFFINSNKRKIFFSVIALVLIFLFVINSNLFSNLSHYGLSENQVSRINNQVSIFLLDTKSINYSERDKLISKGIDLIKDNWLEGYGLGAFESNIYLDQGIHNTYLQVFGEGGIIFFAFYLVLLIAIFKKIWKMNYVKEKFLALSWFGIFLINSISTHGLFYNLQTMFFMGILLFLSNTQIKSVQITKF